MTASTRQADRPGGRTPRAGRGLAAILAAAVVAFAAMPDAGATLRIQNHRLGDICRVVVFVDHGRGARIVHDGPVRRGASHNFDSPGSTVCIQRSSVPQRCNSPLTRAVCRTDRFSNRTTLWTLD